MGELVVAAGCLPGVGAGTSGWGIAVAALVVVAGALLVRFGRGGSTTAALSVLILGFMVVALASPGRPAMADTVAGKCNPTGHPSSTQTDECTKVADHHVVAATPQKQLLLRGYDDGTSNFGTFDVATSTWTDVDMTPIFADYVATLPGAGAGPFPMKIYAEGADYFTEPPFFHRIPNGQRVGPYGFGDVSTSAFGGWDSTRFNTPSADAISHVWQQLDSPPANYNGSSWSGDYSFHVAIDYDCGTAHFVIPTGDVFYQTNG